MKKSQGGNGVLLLFFASSLVVLVIALFAGRMMTSSGQMIAQTSQDKMVALSQAAALLSTPEELDQYVAPEDMEKAEYKALKDDLISFTETAGIAYTYYLRLDTDTNMMQFIIDNTPVDYTALSTPQVAREEAPDIALGGVANAVPLGSYSDGWEGYLTAFAPVHYADGTLSNYVAGVDMQDVYIKQAHGNTNSFSILLVGSMVVVLGSCLLCMNLYRKKAQQSEVASLSKSSFLSNMSHEMRTPMNAIIGMTEIAKNTQDPERIQYCLGKIDDAAGHLLGVINDILDISKIESGKFLLSSSDFQFEKMLQRVTNVINFRVDEKRQEFVIKVEKDVPAALCADQQRLAQVITNLLANATKFTPEGGKIGLFVRKLSDSGEDCVLQFEVSDNGIGIAPEQQAMLFQSFQQADSTISRRFGGTGLGLAISKSIVEHMNGRIWVESEPQKGSRFYFTVQVRKGSMKEAAPLSANISWQDLRLLVVDDAPEIREYFSDIAESIGVSCVTVSGGEEACRLMQQGESFDILFVDWMMPGMDGIELTKRIRAAYGSQVVVIMISAAEWSQIEQEATSAGVNSFISKPLLPSLIVDSINECLGKLPRPAVAADTASATGIFAGKRVLLAEDIEINREILNALLEDTGVQLDCVTNGREACDAFLSSPERYDLVLMDIHMPEMDGYQATKAIRGMDVPRARSIPIVAMTANVFKEDIDRCIEAGMDDHVGKPVDIDEVITKLQKHMAV